MPGAMRAAEHLAIRFKTVPDDAALADFAGGRQALYRALKTVKRVGLAAHRDREGLVISVTAGFAGSHGRQWLCQTAGALRPLLR